MEQHEADMVLRILEMFKNNANAEQEMQKVILMGLSALKKDKEYVQKVPEIEHE